MTASAVKSLASQAALLVVGAPSTALSSKSSQAALLTVYQPPSAILAKTAQSALLLVESSVGAIDTVTSQMALMVVYQTGVPGQSRTRAWTFTLDGHTFYVLNLGPEGTFLYDATTQQWCEFATAGYVGWNMAAGGEWGDRVVGGSVVDGTLYELVPSAVADEGWRDLVHTVTGALATRSRKFLSCEAVRLAASIGYLDEVNGGTITLSWSDDGGGTWSTPISVALTEANYSGEIAWRGLGSFMSPGRIFSVVDTGGVVRIDGADAFVDSFDDDTPQQEGQGSGG